MRKLNGWIRAFLKKGDLLLLFLCVVTTVFGIVIVASATNHLGSSRYVIIQSAALLLGVLLYFIVTLVDVDIFASQRTLLTIFNVFFISLLLVFGVEGTTGNKSWLHFSFLPFNIQPAEFCKITFILIIAKIMATYRSKVSSLRCVGRITLQLFLIVGLIIVISSDAGVALPFIFIFLVMAYIGGVRGWWFLGAFAGVAAAAPLVWSKFMQSYQKNRILMIFDSSIDPEGLGIRYQTNRSLSALSRGGFTGQGLFHGTTVQAGNLPAQHTDFIFSSIGEELGMLGCVVVLLLLSAIIARCIYVGVKARSYMNKLICFGVCAMLIFQVAANVGMCIGVFPVIGLTLPFISYGGSSIVTMFIAMGIVSGIKYRPVTDTTIRYISPYL